MSDPFVYNASPAYMASGYLPRSFPSPQNSPFIPSISPFQAVSPLPGSPQFPTLPLEQNSLAFPGFESNFQPDPFSPIRPRRPSWHGSVVPPSTPFLSPDPLYQSRRRSFGAYTDPYWGPSIVGSPLSPMPFDIHPWLNAQTFAGDFLLDLSSHQFNPLQLVQTHMQRTTVPVPMEYLLTPATQPPVNRLRVVCDLIPMWPIDIKWNEQQQGPVGLGLSGLPPLETSPITVADVLYTIHQSLHTRISHSDWARLSPSEETAVARVYTKRCKAMGSLEEVEKAKGVKRVDFLLGKVWFKGLVMDWTRGEMRMVVG